MLITTEKDREKFFEQAKQVDLSKKPWVFSAEPYKKDRNNAQNRLLYKWLAEIAKQSGNGFAYERGYYKLNVGCPILCESSERFNELYMALVEVKTYEEMIDLMSDEQINVSSIMKIDQFSEYLSRIEKSASERGFRLSHPDDMYYEAMGIKV